MSELTKAAAIEHQQSVIERVIEQRLMDMEDVPIDTGRKIFAQDVVEEMQDLNPDRFMAGVYLAVSATASNQYQGRGICRICAGRPSPCSYAATVFTSTPWHGRPSRAGRRCAMLRNNHMDEIGDMPGVREFERRAADADHARDIEIERVYQREMETYTSGDGEPSYLMEIVERYKEPGQLWHRFMDAITLAVTDPHESGLVMHEVFTAAAEIYAQEESERVA